MSEIQPKIEVRALIDDAQLKKDISFSMNDLSNAMMEQASLATHYGVLLARASRQLDELELLLSVQEAKVDRIVRDKALADARKEYEDEKAAGNTKAKLEKSLTEVQIAKIVAVDPRVIRLKRAINEARQIESMAKTAVDAFKQRRDMLVSTGLTRREEMKGELSIARKSELEEARSEQMARIRKGLSDIRKGE